MASRHRGLQHRVILVAAAAGALALIPCRADAADLLRDDFNGAALDGTKWDIGTWLLGRTQLAFTPQVTGGMARLRLDTYNPGNTSLLRGTEILSDLSFTRGSGIEYEARVRTNAVAAGGTVTSFFTYTADTSVNPAIADEIDFEFLSKHINASPGPSDPVLATTWNNFRTDGSNFGDPNVHSSVNVDVANLNLATFNTFKIRWLPDRVQWYVNDVPIRTAKFAVPDAPAPIRANFWAPNTDWGDAYSGTLQPANNSGANTTYLYDIDHIAVRRIFSGISPAGPGRVITDTFRNGSAANSDAITNLWTQRSQGSSTVTESSAPAANVDEPLRLRAAGAGFPHAQLASNVRGEFNFFKQPLAIEASGIGFSSTSHSTGLNTLGKSILRFSLASQTLTAGTQSEYTVPDALSLRIEGTNLVALGYKVDAPNANSEFTVNLLSQTVAGPVRGVKLVVHGSFYRLQVAHDVSETDSAQTTSNFSGPLTLNLADWTANGDMAMFLQGQLNNSGANENMTAQLDGLAISAVRPTWTPGAGGTSWTTDSNWDWQIAPNFRDANAIFSNGVATPQVLTVDAPATLGSVTFDSAQAHSINASGGGSLTFDTYGDNARIQVSAGAHNVAAPVTLLRNLDVDVAAGGKVTLSNAVNAAGRTITKSGGGELEVSSARAVTLAVAGGAVRVLAESAGGSTSVLQTLSVASGSTVDLRDNDLVLKNMSPGTATGGAYNGVSALVADGRLTTTSQTGGGNGAMLGLGVASAADVLALAPAATGSWSGQPVSGFDTLVKFTYLGDANMDGLVSGDDYAAIDFNVSVPGVSGWYNGDFNYDGIISGDDYSAIDFNIQAQGAPLTSAGAGSSSSVVALPEPASVGAAAVGFAFSLFGGRRRRRGAVSAASRSL
jgi:beta-glucanase (GH16 family)